jgi:hypothetical protein
MDLLGTFFGGPSPAKGPTATNEQRDEFFLSALWNDAMGGTGNGAGGKPLVCLKQHPYLLLMKAKDGLLDM